MLKRNNYHIRSREEFERSLHFVSEAIHRDRFSIGENNQDTIRSLQNVRYLPNHRVDLLTVNELARSVSNGLVQMMQFNDKHEEKE